MYTNFNDPADAGPYTLCVRCGTHFTDSESVICRSCRAKAPAAELESVQSIQSRQAVFTGVVDDLISIYRDFDRTLRPALKIRMKAMYEKLQELGTRIGISRSSLDHLWKG